MKKKSYAVITIMILASLFILIPKNIGENITVEDDTGTEEDDSGMEVDMPDISGIVTNLPWAKDSNFLKAQEEKGTYTLMAAYCAVLKDLSPNEEFNVRLAAGSVAGTVLMPGEMFSQNNAIGPYDKAKGYRSGQSYSGSEITTTIGGVCKVATTLYNVSVYGNLEIMERHNHTMPVPYVPYGQDATVAYGYKDLKFRNNTEFPVLIWARGIENRLYAALYSYERAPKVTWNHKCLSKKPIPRIYKNNPDLADGEERILNEGMEGALVESWITITDSAGVTTSKYIATSGYWPMPCIIEINK